MIRAFRRISLWVVAFNAHYNSLALRERFLLLLSMLAVIYLLWFFLFEKNIKAAASLLQVDNVYLETKITSREIEDSRALKNEPVMASQIDSLLAINAAVDEALKVYSSNGESTLLAVIDNFLSEYPQSKKAIVIDEIVFLPKELIKDLSSNESSKHSISVTNSNSKLAVIPIDAGHSVNDDIMDKYQVKDLYRFSVALSVRGFESDIVKFLKAIEVNNIIYFDYFLIKKLDAAINKQSYSQMKVIFYVLGMD
jgi:hypothetical protein